MEQPPPLSSEEISALAAQQYAQLGEPQPVKVLGILHVIFGSIGALGALYAVYVLLAGNPFAPEGDARMMEIQKQIEQDTMVYSAVGTVMSVIVTALILTAGIQLLQKRKTALMWSNWYAYASIGTKAVNLIFTMMIIVPMTQKMMQEIAGAGAGSLPGAMGGIMYASMIGGFLVSIIYPVLTLALLNRPHIKQWFANQAS